MEAGLSTSVGENTLGSIGAYRTKCFRMTSINLAEKLTLFSELWSPKVVAELNDYQFKLVKFEGDFVWHQHEGTDEAFIVIKGEMQIGFREEEVTVREGELFVVKRGLEHITRAKEECHAMIIEPRGVVNTGEAGGELTANNDVWI
jgi:mannose-6-phosphate isomerase-like protein (cupin superfamily)